MTPTTALSRALLGISFSLFLLLSCSKEEATLENPADQEVFASVSSEADLESEAVSDDVFDNAMGVNAEVGIGGIGIFGAANFESNGNLLNGPQAVDSNRCFQVSVTRLEANRLFPVKIVIDFGNGCTDNKGITRRGKVITIYSKRLIDSGAVATTTFDGHYVNNVKVTGTHKITNVTANKLSFKINATGKLATSDTSYREFSSEKILTLIDGGTTLIPMDDVWSIRGNASGVARNGTKMYQWNKEILEPLIKRFNCRWIVQGIVAHKKGNQRISTLDFGNGDCDNKATLKVNSYNTVITLH